MVPRLSFGTTPPPTRFGPPPRYRGPSHVWLAVVAFSNFHHLPHGLGVFWRPSPPGCLSICGRLCSSTLRFLPFRCLRACCLNSTGGCSVWPWRRWLSSPSCGLVPDFCAVVCSPGLAAVFRGHSGCAGYVLGVYVRC